MYKIHFHKIVQKAGKIIIPVTNTWLQLPGAAHKSTTRFTPVNQIVIKQLKVRYLHKFINTKSIQPIIKK